MIENCFSNDPYSLAPDAGAQRRRERKGPFSFEDMWEVDLSRRVGPQENKGVFLSFAPGSCYESGLALGSTPIAGGLKATWGSRRGPFK